MAEQIDHKCFKFAFLRLEKSIVAVMDCLLFGQHIRKVRADLVSNFICRSEWSPLVSSSLVETIANHFEEVKDHRANRDGTFLLIEMFFAALRGMICDSNSWVDIKKGRSRVN